ncbi:hypothetical protein [Amycolatopsis aidingensis]|uniref:hypothetical protein n=1 Tax=Amycolatopsis aidingensis TaxID=2842453 RepID=UPI001C0E0B71|nr:hypothetical protein [Amycolatopsis aidingensis]
MTNGVTPPADLTEFARWAFGAVTVNTHRGWYAEWLVRNALGDSAERRGEWAPVDLITPDVKVEVKCTGSMQDWLPGLDTHGRPKPPSPPDFSGLVARRWTGYGNVYTEPMVLADAYVFAVHTCTDRVSYDVGDSRQWSFYVASGATVQRWRQKSIRLTVLKQRGVPEFSLAELPWAVRSHAETPEGADAFDWSPFLESMSSSAPE